MGSQRRKNGVTILRYVSSREEGPLQDEKQLFLSEEQAHTVGRNMLISLYSQRHLTIHHRRDASMGGGGMLSIRLNGAILSSARYEDVDSADSRRTSYAVASRDICWSCEVHGIYKHDRAVTVPSDDLPPDQHSARRSNRGYSYRRGYHC